MEEAIARGYYLAGFLSYEAGYAFEELFHHNKTYDFPLVCFGAFKKPTSSADFQPAPFFICDGEGKTKKGLSPLHLMERGGGSRRAPACRQAGVRIKRDYLTALRRIHRLIAAGETYQINYTFKRKFDFSGDPFALYQRLKKRQATPYSAFIDSKGFSILSLSPELFFKKQGDKITVKPMKGTIGIGKGNRNRLKADMKNRAENLMIVDLLRNDLGRIARFGSVKTIKLFEVEKYKTLYQMTSSIEAKIEPTIQLYKLFRNLYPSGSVTGAPKIRAMQIIRELEKEERKIYCGSIGVITPARNMVFNVAIRTILLTPHPLPLTLYSGELGLGSGIVFDSDPAKEYEECLLKGEFLVG
ncbi:hypothetical protein A2625_06350 [candidate division WOR-1 bacterium RIFCSPHIGHO2_01_FULL_53_15]|uniref:Chorismate-utilising enzyme C-terminal domain-containing protein n=1 Tax=candidate division WOR-1 bacterium RIFCSPHIGHO2_01_FULL_53_15 TaxID=1802564 RepID=A0A1F4Q1B7_UNCSA|nr:MAG: hypothetical protein A2625_06350 [candidate division WOR-1 bacterium RIFCSPHIGHO2_01_FULL_53_15]OGC13796.1 MAG: hypothetical protein A3D23_01875 [candidate division WOR-1 bacterium RIFCSPHIGHO2_02_FULL_53_26]